MLTVTNWPQGKAFAVFVNVAFEAWLPGQAPGVSPMGNPLPPGLLDTQARSWAAYGYRRGVWRLLDLLRDHGVSATFMTNGVLAQLAPDAVRAIAEQGHRICAHGWSQGESAVGMSPAEERTWITRTRDTLAEVSGAVPQGWISPRVTAGPHTPELLADEGFTWFGDIFDDDWSSMRLPGGRLLFVPFTTEVTDLALRMKYGQLAETYEASFDQTLAATRRFADGNLFFDVTVHAHLSGRPLGAYYFERVLSKLVTLDDAWVTTRDEAAAHILAQRRDDD